MGAKISKRGSYNLKKREKKSKINKLEGRTSSIINLTLSQIYEDELKTPKLGNYEKHKDFGQIYENENAVNKNEPMLNTIQNINDRSDSEREDYSNPDDEKIYENIVDESNSNFEEQVEKKEEKERRKTWSQSESHDGDKYFGVRDSISEESERSNEHWKEILNGGYWRNENDSTLAEQIEVKEDKSEEQVEVVVNNNQKPEDSDMQQVEVNIYENSNDKEEQILVTEINDDLHNFNNEEQVEVLSENISYEQIEVKADVEQNNLQEFVEVSTQAKPEGILHQNWEFENKVEEGIQSMESDSLSKPKEINGQIEKNIQMEKTESTILHLEEELKSDTQNETQVIEFKDVNIQQNSEISNIDDSYTEKENKVNERPQGHKQLSKTVSSTSDAFYEVASEGWTEDSEYEEFYDAEEFQNETQIEVVDEELIMNTNKGVLNEKTTVEVEEKLNHNSATNEVIDIKSQAELESPNIDLKENNGASEGLFIDIDYSKSETDNVVSKTKENLSESTDNSIVMSETSLMQINKTAEPSYNESEPSSLLVNLNEDSKPAESPNTQLRLLESSNSDLLLGFTDLESSVNGKDVSFQTDLLIDFNEETSTVNQETDHLKQSANLELNNKFQEDVEDDIKDTLKNQFVPLVETDIEDKNNAITNEDPFNTKTEDLSNAIHMEHIDGHKSSKTEDLHKQHNYNNTDTISKLENSLIYENRNDQDSPQQSLSEITTEDIARDQMMVWKKQKNEEDQGTILQINAIITNINQVKLQIDNLESTEKDQEIYGEMYQTLIKLMRNVNSINNDNFNERIIELQNIALSKIHSCLQNLQMKNT